MSPWRPLPGRRALIGPVGWQKGPGLLIQEDHQASSDSVSKKGGQGSGITIQESLFVETAALLLLDRMST